MGKIFDALEKSKKEHRESIHSADIAGEYGDSQAKNTSVPEPLSSLPDIEGYLDESLVTVFKPQSFEAEQFKVLKTNLLFPGSGESPRVIMVTSAIPGEGKTFVASNLAVSIAQNIDEHVLLMDCDLRLPSVHKRFGLKQVNGLSEYLSGKIGLSSIFLKTKINKLTLIPGGRPPHNPSELLVSDQMTSLIKELRNRYQDRFVIIDSAPPQLTAESNALAKQVDGILLVINNGVTKRNIIKELVETLGKEKIIGTILNRHDIRSSLLKNYGKYSKYYHRD